MLLIRKELQRAEARILRRFRRSAIKCELVKRHFTNQGFAPDLNGFGWREWASVPFFTKEDFMKIGLEARLEDTLERRKEQLYGFMLRVTSGTSGMQEPPLFLRSVGAVSKEGELRTLWIYDSFVQSLQGALIHILKNQKTGSSRHQALVLTRAELRPEAYSGISDFGPDNLCGFPSNLMGLIDPASGSFQGSPSFFSLVKIIYIGGDFLSTAQYMALRYLFKIADVSLEYGLSEFGKIGFPCRFLQERYGFNAYHPVSGKSLIELVDIDDEGYGEIVGTNLTRIRLSLIRYRTGDIGRALEERCQCGEDFTLFVIGRKNFDYVKCGGAMIVRQELDRVMLCFKKYVEDWRAEAREVRHLRSAIGELTLKIKPTAELNCDKDSMRTLASQISGMLYITPTETLMSLSQKQKFMPLKLEIAVEFPYAPKRILIRKIAF